MTFFLLWLPRNVFLYLSNQSDWERESDEKRKKRWVYLRYQEGGYHCLVCRASKLLVWLLPGGQLVTG